MAIASDTMGQTPGGTLSLIDAATGVRRSVHVPDPERSPFLNQIEAFGEAVLSGRPFAFSARARFAPVHLDGAIMPLIQYACAHCGFWQPWFAGQSPIGCPVCMDVRNALPPDGWDFRTVDDLTGKVTTRWVEALPGIVGFSCDPAFGLGSTGWLLLREEGNIAFEGAPFYTPEALDEIERLGGISILAGSHPHGFGALWQLAERFDPTVVIHRDGLRYTKAFRVSWPADDVHQLAPGLTMIATQGHYEGHAVLHDARDRALFCGDCLKVDLDAARPSHRPELPQGFPLPDPAQP